ncbi:hypothetical protein ALC56_14408 [Trachymyrmex septentrionalis]|uniref:Uncharacterized protein n=1 Tax=Trachymyrmex septentrionalis TaxID=34720 RepID=A0A195EUF1_9HYME|nr:hypothetical protein ALC56_14408 [Trachymyrmex septentrionalis]
MREVSSERYKNFYPGSTSGIYQHRQGAADFLSDFLVYPIPVELRREIPIGWRLLALLERDEIRIRKEINYPFSKAEVSRLKGVGSTISHCSPILRILNRQLVRRGRGHERAKKPGKLVPRLRELRGDFGRKSVASGWCPVLAGHPVHTPHLPRFTARRKMVEVMPEVTRTEVKLTLDAPLCAISSKNVQNVVIRLAEEFCKQHDA